MLKKHQAKTSTIVAALRAMCEAHEASGFSCITLNPAYLEAKVILRQLDGATGPQELQRTA